MREEELIVRAVVVLREEMGGGPSLGLGGTVSSSSSHGVVLLHERSALISRPQLSSRMNSKKNERPELPVGKDLLEYRTYIGQILLEEG